MRMHVYGSKCMKALPAFSWEKHLTSSWLICALFLVLPFLASAQSPDIPSAAGHADVGSNIHLDWSIGYGAVAACAFRQAEQSAESGISWSVQPNPTYRSIQINIPSLLRGHSIQIHLTDALSRRVWNRQISQAGVTEDLDLGQLPAGTYLLHLDNGSLPPVPPIRLVKLSSDQNP